jgi:hypothetical protein
VSFVDGIKRKALGFLGSYNPFVFPQYLVVEIVDVLNGQIGVEVPCDRGEETSHFSRCREAAFGAACATWASAEFCRLVFVPLAYMELRMTIAEDKRASGLLE